MGKVCTGIKSYSCNRGKERDSRVYKLVSAVSVFIRTFIFPNPFNRLFELYLADTLFSSSALVFAELFNYVVGGTVLFISLALFVEIIILLGIRYVKEQLYWFIVIGGCVSYIKFKPIEMIGDLVKKNYWH